MQSPLAILLAGLLYVTPALCEPINVLISDQVYRITLTECGTTVGYVQTGFHARVHGDDGLITALHGVAFCNTRTATKGEGANSVFIYDLELKWIDFERDIAFLSSNQLAAFADEPLQGVALDLSESHLKVVGYPYGVLSQLSSPVSYHENPRRRLGEFATTFLTQLEQRGSPDPNVEVLAMLGTIVPGNSGSPILNPAQKVIGVAIGGLAGGVANINWMIPFTEINWVSLQTHQGQVQSLSQMDLTQLFATPIETSPETQTDSGARITGRIFYNDRPVTAYSKAYAAFQLMEVEERKDVPVDFEYDNETGQFTVSNVPAGKYTPFIRLEAGYPFYIESGGDFFGRISGMNPDIVVAPHEREIRRDLEVVHVIHLTQPVDNQQRRTTAGDPPETLYDTFYAPSAERFVWDPVPGAARYELWFLLMDGNTNQRKDAKSYTVSTTQFSPGLQTNRGNDYYIFTMTAYSASGKKIGFYEHYYKNGSGGWFEFNVVPYGHERNPLPKAKQGFDPKSVVIHQIDVTSTWPIVYTGRFADWPRVHNEQGQVGEAQNAYVMEANSNTWMGPGRKIPITPLAGDFALNLSFRVLRGNNVGLHLTLSDAGSDYAQMSFYFSIWDSQEPTFSIYQEQVKQNFYVNTTRSIADRKTVPQSVATGDFGRQNRLSVRREGQKLGLYLNGSVLETFEAPSFRVQQIGVGLAFPSKIAIDSIEARVPN